VSRIKTFKNFKTFDIRSRNQTPNICAEMANSQLARWPMEAINQVRLLFPTKPRLIPGQYHCMCCYWVAGVDAHNGNH
jgi:hypothetical protein